MDNLNIKSGEQITLDKFFKFVFKDSIKESEMIENDGTISSKINSKI